MVEQRSLRRGSRINSMLTALRWLVLIVGLAGCDPCPPGQQYVCNANGCVCIPANYEQGDRPHG
jgi:hypothetical protein